MSSQILEYTLAETPLLDYPPEGVMDGTNMVNFYSYNVDTYVDHFIYKWGTENESHSLPMNTWSLSYDGPNLLLPIDEKGVEYYLWITSVNINGEAGDILKIGPYILKPSLQYDTIIYNNVLKEGDDVVAYYSLDRDMDVIIYIMNDMGRIFNRIEKPGMLGVNFFRYDCLIDYQAKGVI